MNTEKKIYQAKNTTFLVPKFLQIIVASPYVCIVEMKRLNISFLFLLYSCMPLYLFKLHQNHSFRKDICAEIFMVIKINKNRYKD
jgi:hypothetical protein